MHDASHAMREVLGDRRTPLILSGLRSSDRVVPPLGFAFTAFLPCRCISAYEARHLEKMVDGEKGRDETRRPAITEAEDFNAGRLVQNSSNAGEEGSELHAACRRVATALPSAVHQDSETATGSGSTIGLPVVLPSLQHTYTTVIKKTHIHYQKRKNARRKKHLSMSLTK